MDISNRYKLQRMTKNDLNFEILIWDMNLVDYFSRYMSKKYYHPFIIKKEDETCGVSQLIVNDKISWLGLIVVLELHQGKGLGRAMTEQLIKTGRELGCQTQLLFATEMGEPLYRKLGFEYDEYYIYAKPPLDLPHFEIEGVIRYEPFMEKEFFKLDQKLSGESRRAFLSDYLNNCFVFFQDGKIQGYYLPELGNGLLNADNTESAINLMKFKINKSQRFFIIPESNKVGIDFLKSIGYFFDKKVPRMYYGKKPTTDMSKIFCRGTGYSG